MKKIFVIFVLLFSSNYLFANENNFKCIFSFSEYINQDTPINNELIKLMNFDKFRIYADFKSISKSKWIIEKLNIDKDLIKILKDGLESNIDIYKKIIYQKKLSSTEKEYRRFILKEADLTLDEFNQLIKILSKKEKEQIISQYINEYKTFNNQYISEFEDITKNQKEHFDQYINTFEKYGEVNVNGNKIKVTTATDAGMLIENIIDYQNLLKKESYDSVSLKMTFTDGNSAKFTSKCLNKTYLSDNKQTNQSNNIETKLKKLKSLFEQNLITQDEYDAKRKEILDAM